jgi:tetratricopeptide (TPR) repeat protein/pimeloyl-ACP methyl ester carboxylesterase
MAQIIHVGSGHGELRANVIFLHGLGGDPDGTWRSGPDDQSFWPQWLIDDAEGLKVYSVGYESPVSRWTGTAMHLTERADNVLARILAEPDLRTRPLILIGHSLGGLVIKQLLRTAESKARYSADAARFLERVEKVAFLATPHSGADLARWGDRLRIAIRPSAATACLVRNDANLRDLNLWYRDWANDRHMAHLTLTETDAISILGMIVKPDSGDAGLAGSRPVSISADHFTICKPVDRNHDTYVLVRSFIETPFERPATPAEKALAALNTKIDKLVAAHAESGKTTYAEKAGVGREVVIQLAQRINADVDDFDRAMVELERAVAVAVEVVEEGRRGSNTGDFVDVVLKRIAEKSAKGQFDEAAVEADAGFAQWELDETERRNAAVAGGLKLLDAGLRQDILRRDPKSAAKRIERMVSLEHPDDRTARFVAMRRRQNEWYASGSDKGLNLDLQVSIETARLLLASASGPNEAGAAQIDLGVALFALGERESSTANLEQSVDTYRAALEEWARDRIPLRWAELQNNLGNTLLRLGERESGTARLEQAVDAYRAALEERTRESVPLDWASTQNNLGAALFALGERESGITCLEQAVDAYRAALQECPRERVPLDWAMTQNNLGGALSRLGEHRSSATHLQEAADAYRAALLERTRERVPLQWATTQNNLGCTLLSLGVIERSTSRLEQAVDAYRVALEERTRIRVPLDWATTQNNLGNALLELGRSESDTTRLVEAIDTYRAALEERTRESVPLDWAMTQSNLGIALVALGERESGAATFGQAVDAYRAALEEYTRERVPHLHEETIDNLANALRKLELRRNGDAP